MFFHDDMQSIRAKSVEKRIMYTLKNINVLMDIHLNKSNTEHFILHYKLHTVDGQDN